MSAPTFMTILGIALASRLPVSAASSHGIQFEFASYQVAEDAGSVLIGVLRGDSGNYPVTVDYATTNVTAIAGEDYQGTSSTLTFAVGEKVKLFTIPILNDALNNLRQLQTAWLMYADDHNDLMCPNTSSGTDVLSWRSPPGSWVLGNAQVDAALTNIQSGVLFPYSQSVGVYRCPADRSLTVKAPKVLRNRSTMLSLLFNGNILGDDTWSGHRKTKVSEITSPPPSSVWAFLDASEREISSGDFAVVPGLFWRGPAVDGYSGRSPRPGSESLVCRRPRRTPSMDIP